MGETELLEVGMSDINAPDKVSQSLLRRLITKLILLENIIFNSIIKKTFSTYKKRESKQLIV